MAFRLAPASPFLASPSRLGLTSDPLTMDGFEDTAAVACAAEPYNPDHWYHEFGQLHVHDHHHHRLAQQQQTPVHTTGVNMPLGSSLVAAAAAAAASGGDAFQREAGHPSTESAAAPHTYSGSSSSQDLTCMEGPGDFPHHGTTAFGSPITPRSPRGDLLMPTPASSEAPTAVTGDDGSSSRGYYGQYAYLQQDVSMMGSSGSWGTFLGQDPSSCSSMSSLNSSLLSYTSKVTSSSTRSTLSCSSSSGAIGSSSGGPVPRPSSCKQTGGAKNKGGSSSSSSSSRSSSSASKDAAAAAAEAAAAAAPRCKDTTGLAALQEAPLVAPAHAPPVTAAKSKAARRLSLHGEAAALSPSQLDQAAGLLGEEVHGVVRVVATQRAAAAGAGRSGAAAPSVTGGGTSVTRSSLQDKLVALGLYPGSWCGAAPLL
jgi:hypothetical protein